ncbi:uncharacterized protein [Oscarella lobularis]|uniref:uncharacterized protein n=1 Tax=Oscarella lobularis TaxID=121494 RepID=UPI003313FE2D
MYAQTGLERSHRFHVTRCFVIGGAPANTQFYSSKMTPFLFAAVAVVAGLFSPAIATPTNCTYAKSLCTQDGNCSQAYNTYISYCNPAFSSRLKSDCTAQCNSSRAEVNRLQPALADCVCDMTQCSLLQRSIAKACFDIDLPARFCNDFRVDCERNSTCHTSYQNFLSTSCKAVIGSAQESDCTDACKMDLKVLIDFDPVFRTCSCGEDTNCVPPFRNLRIGCCKYIYGASSCQPTTAAPTTFPQTTAASTTFPATTSTTQGPAGPTGGAERVSVFVLTWIVAVASLVYYTA